MASVEVKLLCSASGKFSRGLCVFISVAYAHPTRAGLRVIYISISYAFLPTAPPYRLSLLLVCDRRHIVAYVTARPRTIVTLDNIPPELVILIAQDVAFSGNRLTLSCIVTISSQWQNWVELIFFYNLTMC